MSIFTFCDGPFLLAEVYRSEAVASIARALANECKVPVDVYVDGMRFFTQNPVLSPDPFERSRMTAANPPHHGALPASRPMKMWGGQP